MNTSKTVRIVGLVAAAAVALGATAVALAQGTARATSVPLCVKTNGQLRVLVGGVAACDSSEQRTDWVVGGEVTDIALGPGLIGGRNGGAIQLAVNPALLERGRVFSGFNDGPVAVPIFFSETIARLDLPAGNFAISAKLTVTSISDEGFDDRVLCTLWAEGDFDRAEAVLPEDVNPPVMHPYEAAVGLAMQVVHRYAAPGAVTLSCFEQGGDPDVSFQDLKITAIEATSLSNVFLATP